MDAWRAEILNKVEGYGYDLSMYPSWLLVDAFDYASEVIWEKTQAERDPTWTEFDKCLVYLIELNKVNYD